ncbi:MAG: PAS domain S-box protein [Magnetococcales bacterium]|nr:PAS domain S-box protein [Magnetococcales bacterium]
MSDKSAPRSSQPVMNGQSGILTVVLVYVLFAALWILLSDRVVIWLFRNPDHILLASTLKGWLFVVVTALLLYGMLRRLPWIGSPPRVTGTRFRLILGALVGAIMLAVGASMVHTFKTHREESFSRLLIIAELKAKQIGDWLIERLDDMEFVQKNSEILSMYQSWLAKPTPEGRQKLEAHLELLRRSHDYRSVVLFDDQGHVIQTSAERESPVESFWSQSGQEGGDVRIDIRSDRDGLPRVGFRLPLTGMESAAWIVLVVDPTDWLYPMLQFWPMPEHSGETLLFRKQGDQVLFLNDLRYLSQAALRLQLSLERHELLAAQILNGVVAPGQLIVGLDYRNLPVFGVARAIPKTDWFIIAKIDQDELYREMTRTFSWILLAGVLAMFAATMALTLLRRGEQLAVANELHQAQEERLHVLQLLDAIVNSSEDAIFAKDLSGRYILFNKAAGRFVGRAEHEVLGYDDRMLFPPDQAESIQSADRRVIAENRSLVQEESLNTHQGPRVFHAFKGPLRDFQGGIIGSYGIAQDITERKRAEEGLRRSELLFRTLFQTAAVSIILYDKESGAILDANRRALVSYGYEQISELQRHEFWIDPPYSRDDALKLLHRTAEEGKQRFEWKNRDRHGVEFWEDVLLNIIVIDGTERILAVSIDITARKNVEAEFLRLTVETIQRNEELERFNEAMVGRELTMIALKQQLNALSLELGREVPYPMARMEEALPPGEGA